MVLPVPEFAQAGDNNRKIVRIRSVQCIKEFTNRAASLGGLVEFDGEFHRLNINIGVVHLVKSSAWLRLRPRTAATVSPLPRYHALVEFADADALDAAMKQQVQRGVYAGGHGRVIDVVCDFHVELFTSLAADVEAEALQACEI